MSPKNRDLVLRSLSESRIIGSARLSGRADGSNVGLKMYPRVSGNHRGRGQSLVGVKDMDSILNTSGRRKCIVVKSERTYRVVKGDLGTQLKREPLHIWRHKKHKPPTRKRGDIEGFSENSRSRLRVLLSTAKWKGGKCRRFGFTLTLPWAATPNEWRKVWKSFLDLLRKHDNLGLIWRIELTTGKAERSGGLRRCHVHAMVWLPLSKPLRRADASLFGKDESLDCMLNLRAFGQEWISAWQSSAPPLTKGQIDYATSIGEGKNYGVSYKPLDDSKDGAIHYLCDHASKHKQEQLGWKGRQWGVVNRRCFAFPSEDDGERISGKDWAVASRALRRYSRRLRQSGSKRAQPYGDNKCFFGHSEKVLNDVIRAVKDGRITSGKDWEGGGA